MRRLMIAIIFFGLVLPLGPAFAPGEVISRLDNFFKFFDVHLIGNTLIRQDFIPTDDGNRETEVTHQHTYTNLIRDKDSISFDVFAVVTHADYEFHPNGERRDESRTLSARDVSLTQYTVHTTLNRQRLFGIGRCLSHTKTELIGTTTTVELWFSADTLKLMTHTPGSLKSGNGDSDRYSEGYISLQDFWVEEQRVRSKSVSRYYSIDTNTLAVTNQEADPVTAEWNEAINKTPIPHPLQLISEREDILIKAIEKSGTETMFLVMHEGYLYPCKRVGGIFESFPAQVDVKTYHDNDLLRTVLHQLLLPNEMDVSVYTMEILSGTQWEPAASFQWDNDVVIVKTDEAPESKKYTPDRIRFKKLGD